MLSSTFFVNYLPLATIQILLLNFVSDVPLMSVSTDNVDQSDLIKPSKTNFNRLMTMTMVMGTISTFFDFVIFFYFRDFGQQVLQSSWFLGSVLTEIIIIFSLRSPNFFLKSSKPSLFLSITAGITALGAVLCVYNPTINKFLGFTPIGFEYLSIVFGITITYFILSEIVKVILHRIGWLN